MENIETIKRINASIRMSTVSRIYNVGFIMGFYWNALTRDCFFFDFYFSYKVDPVSLLFLSVYSRPNYLFIFSLSRLSL